MPFEVAVVRGDRRPRGIEVHRSRLLEDGDVIVHLGIPVTCPALTEQLLRNPRHPGCAKVAECLSSGDGPTRSDWERAFPAFCDAHRLPRPVLATRV